MGSLVPSNLLESLGFLFADQKCTILEAKKTRSTSGAEVETWEPKAGHVDIPCVLSAQAGNIGQFREVVREGETTMLMTYKCLLQGAFPEVTERDRVLSDGKTYTITAPTTDSQGVMTTLRCQILR